MVIVSPLMADSVTELQKLVATDRAEGDQFGICIDIDGNYAIVGADCQDKDASGGNMLTEAGAAYIYYYDGNNWNQQAKLVASDRAISDYFGSSVSISGDVAIVGAPIEFEDASGVNPLAGAGSAYMFRRSGTTWTQKAKVVASDREVDDYFGCSVSIDGNYAIVGAYAEDEDALGNNEILNTGSAYVFYYDGNSWSQQCKLVALDRADSDLFGRYVSISGDVAIVTAYMEDEDAVGANSLQAAGSAYVFQRSGTIWSQEAKLVPSDRGVDDNFGSSVSIDGNYVIIGANREDEDASDENYVECAGSAYIFYNNGSSWSQQAKLVASIRATYDYFGSSVSISGDIAIAGVKLEDEDASEANTIPDAGSVYMFRRSESIWSQSEKLVAIDRFSNDQLGYSVGISGEKILIGAIYEDEDASGENTLDDAGAVYSFELEPEVPLPITLQSFEAKTNNGSVVLNWTTASETNNMAFRIYRNGKLLTGMEGAGTTFEPKSYTFTDKTVIPGVQYTYVLSDVDYSNTETRYDEKAVKIMIDGSDIVTEFVVNDAYPNPFNPSTTIDYQLPESRDVTMVLYDLTGRKIRTLINDVQGKGAYSVRICADNLSAGIYLCRFTAGEEVRTMKLLLMK